MRVLVACEESQRVCSAFRERGHEAYSCDIVEPSGGHPEWHIQKDVLGIIDGCCGFLTLDGTYHMIPDRWDIIIAHPPCIYLTNTANRWFNIEKYGEEAIQRHRKREEASEFFMRLVNANCDRIAVENPIGCMSTRYRKPDQIIQPYEFGHDAKKATCLWLKGLPKLTPTCIVDIHVREYAGADGRMKRFSLDYDSGGGKRSVRRAKTYTGIAKAMAEQWGEIE